MTVVERFSQLDPGEFEAEVNRLWSAGEKVIETIVEQVKEETITPVQGLAIIGCTTSQLYAYNAFHGEATQADLVGALTRPAALSGSR